MKQSSSLFAATVAFVALSASAAWAGVIPKPVPEPSSLALLAAGIGGLAWHKFRRK